MTQGPPRALLRVCAQSSHATSHAIRNGLGTPKKYSQQDENCARVVVALSLAENMDDDENSFLPEFADDEVREAHRAARVRVVNEDQSHRVSFV